VQHWCTVAKRLNGSGIFGVWVTTEDRYFGVRIRPWKGRPTQRLALDLEHFLLSPRRGWPSQQILSSCFFVGLFSGIVTSCWARSKKETLRITSFMPVTLLSPSQQCKTLRALLKPCSSTEFEHIRYASDSVVKEIIYSKQNFWSDMNEWRTPPSVERHAGIYDAPKPQFYLSAASVNLEFTYATALVKSHLNSCTFPHSGRPSSASIPLHKAI